MAEKGFFALRLKELRLEAGLSQAQLAGRADMPVATIRQLEYSRREPTFSTLVKLAGGLGVELSAFQPPEKRPGRRPRKGK